MKKAEINWIKRFQRVVKDIPDTLEVVVSNGGNITIHERGSMNKCFKKHGHMDHVDEFGDINEGVRSYQFISRSESI